MFDVGRQCERLHRHLHLIVYTIVVSSENAYRDVIYIPGNIISTAAIISVPTILLLLMKVLYNDEYFVVASFFLALRNCGKSQVLYDEQADTVNTAHKLGFMP